MARRIVRVTKNGINNSNKIMIVGKRNTTVDVFKKGNYIENK